MRIRRIVVGLDLSDISGAVLDAALDVAQPSNATLHVVYAHQARPGPVYQGLSEVDRRIAERRASLEGLVSLHARRGTDVVVHVEVGEPAEVIQSLAEHVRADMIVVGTHGQSRLAAALLGSVAERTLRQSSVPVLTVPAAAVARRRRQGAPGINVGV